MKLEIACFNQESALRAARENVDRIELCSDYSIGGITPPLHLLKSLKKQFETPIFSMIRPRGGDFSYTEKEFEQMKETLVAYRKNGADGFVFGILTPKGMLDVERNRELIELADDKPCTFHRAFDVLKNKKEALRQLIACGFKTVLTSGGEHPAEEGLDTLKMLKHHAGNQITILAGGGIRPANIHLFRDLDFVHSACIKPGTDQLDVEELKRLKNKIASF